MIHPENEAEKNGTPEQRPEGLSPNQWEILQLVIEGVPYKDVAQRMRLSEQTVKYHMARIIGILGVENRSQAISKAQAFLNKI
jgi:DNA-binding NarL/FixJ family response regulator